VSSNHPHDRSEYALEHLASDVSDDVICVMVGDFLITAALPSTFPPRYKFAVRWDATVAPCPVQSDAIVRGKTLCVVERDDEAWCREWLYEALKKGLTVTRITGDGRNAIEYYCSLETVRQSIARRETMEEIPF
jgi:hypothetical protein